MNFDYTYHDNLLTPEEIVQLREAVIRNIDLTLKDQKAPNVQKTSDVALCLYEHVINEWNKIHQYLLYTNMHHFGFDLFEKPNFDCLLYNTYDSTNRATYDWHKDSVEGLNYDYKLSVLVNLSDRSYKGGDLELFLTGGICTIDQFNTPGAILVFPSWTVHRVTPVTEGKRISLATFYSGPNFK